MLFNSLEFILAFLPLTLLGYHLLAKLTGARLAFAFLAFASLFFYGWWSPIYLGLLIGSILFNFYVGKLLGQETGHSKLILWIGIVFDLALLAFFKYTDFAIANFNHALDIQVPLLNLVLPLGISFFTFQQISYRMECYRGHRKQDSFLEYVTCVSFFPHLIAGPIALYQELIPQLTESAPSSVSGTKWALGLSVFTVGLFKKVVIADNLALIATPTFSRLLSSAPPPPDALWACMAYMLQIYFDFSGYCDMAIGLSLFFGIRLPLNFYSPYKARSIIEFWRTWHITLGRFLRDYVYIPLGGGRSSTSRKLINLFSTMIVGGIWHGANWTFVCWGATHGIFLAINHLWRMFAPTVPKDFGFLGWLYDKATWTLTLTCVFCAWIFFRAESVAAAKSMLYQLSLLQHHSFSSLLVFSVGGEQLNPIEQLCYIFLVLTAFAIALFAPNIYEMLSEYKIALFTRSTAGDSLVEEPIRPSTWINFRVNFVSGFITAGLFLIVFKTFFMATPSEFLYFNF